MSAVFLFTNNASSNLAGAINNTALTANLSAGTGALFPNPGANQQFALTFHDAATRVNYEVVYVTGRSGDTITMLRGQEGTVAQNWQAGDLADLLITAGTAQAWLQQAQASPTKVVTASGPFVIANNDGSIFMNRTVAPAASSAAMPAAPIDGQTIRIIDFAKNFNKYPVTLTPNAGQSFPNNEAQVVLNVNGQVGELIFCATGNLWSFKS